MRIFGVDPGYAIVGYGIVDFDGVQFSAVGYGAITTKAGVPFPERLESIYEDVITVIEKYKPDCMAIERLYFNTNTTTAIDVAQARGVIMLAAKRAGLEIFEYTPLQVKQSITGYGRAEKHQVMEMVKNLLSLSSVPKPDDTADALALTVCHGHSAGSSYGKLNQLMKGKTK
ncbi:MAG: crossover junction endodeoxyribonuclease RuvC [Clostridia bacterium]|nr:crossover junction endodeoxyribonuclease RuvC [Clostridia bacterium]